MLLKNNGITLLELLIVIAIVGILGSFAIPNFSSFIRKAREAEAKMLLSSLYTVEKAYYLQYEAYSSVLDAIGFSPTGEVHYNIGFDVLLQPQFGSSPSDGKCITLCPAINCPIATWQCTASSSNALDASATATITTQRFRASAHAHFSPAPEDYSSFTIDEKKNILAVIPAN